MLTIIHNSFEPRLIGINGLYKTTIKPKIHNLILSFSLNELNAKYKAHPETTSLDSINYLYGLIKS